jgi:hypothetical protein
MPDHVLPKNYDLAEEPLNEVSISLADGMFVKHYRIKKVGTYLPQHSHTYDHSTLVCHGSVRAWVDGRYLGKFDAPSAITIKAHSKHLFEVMEPNTTLACIHRVDRTGEIEVDEEHQIV